MEETDKIKFGTDGWRGVIAGDFTFENVRIVAQAISDYVKQPDAAQRLAVVHGTVEKKVQEPNLRFVIGYDNRFLSEKFAQEVAKVFSANGIDVAVSSTAATSPSVSFYCKKNNCLGIMITASHNPYIWNGLKIKLQYGGSVSENIIGEVSGFLYKTKPSVSSSETKTVDILTDYKKYLKSLVEVHLPPKLKIAVDSMHGSGAGIFGQLLGNKKNVIEIHGNRDPLFSGFNPEPIEKNLTELKKLVVKNRASVGFAFDGDADRLGFVDDKGNYLPPHTVFPLILQYLLNGRKLRGKVVQTISLGYLSERIAKKFGIPFEEIPVGFKYVCEKMLTEDVLLGGEESGGYGWKGGIPERDGLLNALLITEMLSKTNKKLSQLVSDLKKEFGKSYFLRNDIKLVKPVIKDEFTDYVKKTMSTEKGIKEVRTFDGIKIIFENDNWLLLRPSGTEPVLRTYSETDSLAKTKKRLDFAKKICFNLLPK